MVGTVYSCILFDKRLVNVVFPEFYNPIILQFNFLDLNNLAIKSEKTAPI